jgi:hypothetical protein
MQQAPDRLERYGGIMRIGMALLIVPQAITGAWAFLAPRSFFEDFPGFGRTWISPIGAYNEHFITDTGALFLVMCLVMGLAAYYLERRLVRIALVCWLAFSVPHFISHTQLTSSFSSSDNAGTLGTLGMVVLLPLLLLILTWRDTRLVGER